MAKKGTTKTENQANTAEQQQGTPPVDLDVTVPEDLPKTENQANTAEQQQGKPGKMVKVVSPSRANKTIVAVTGSPISFDDKGEAFVSVVDSVYLENCVDFVVG